MEREQIIEAMCVAAYSDEGADGWSRYVSAGNPHLGLVRDRMARVYDAIEPEIRKDVTMQLLNQVVATAVAAKP